MFRPRAEIDLLQGLYQWKKQSTTLSETRRTKTVDVCQHNGSMSAEKKIEDRGDPL